VQAVRLNLARALARGGQCSEAVALYRQLAGSTAMRQDTPAQICYAYALQVGRWHRWRCCCCCCCCCCCFF
jgi:hypothetical protein